MPMSVPRTNPSPVRPQCRRTPFCTYEFTRVHVRTQRNRPGLASLRTLRQCQRPHPLPNPSLALTADAQPYHTNNFTPVHIRTRRSHPSLGNAHSKPHGRIPHPAQTNPTFPSNTVPDQGRPYTANCSEADLPTELRHAAFFQAEYDMVVLPGRITSREAYFKARRPGRGVALDRARRAEVWKVVESYRARVRASTGGSTSGRPQRWQPRPSRGGRPHWSDHVLVDEGQDLAPDPLAVPEGAGRRGSGRPVHRRGRPPAHLRSSGGARPLGDQDRRPIQAAAAQLPDDCAEPAFRGAGARTGGYSDLESEAAEVTGYRSARRGPAPRLIKTDNLTQGTRCLRRSRAGWTVRRGRTGLDRHPGAGRYAGPAGRAWDGRAREQGARGHQPGADSKDSRGDDDAPGQGDGVLPGDHLRADERADAGAVRAQGSDRSEREDACCASGPCSTSRPRVRATSSLSCGRATRVSSSPERRRERKEERGDEG